MCLLLMVRLPDHSDFEQGSGSFNQAAGSCGSSLFPILRAVALSWLTMRAALLALFPQAALSAEHSGWLEARALRPVPPFPLAADSVACVPEESSFPALSARHPDDSAAAEDR